MAVKLGVAEKPDAVDGNAELLFHVEQRAIEIDVHPVSMGVPTVAQRSAEVNLAVLAPDHHSRCAAGICGEQRDLIWFQGQLGQLALENRGSGNHPVALQFSLLAALHQLIEEFPGQQVQQHGLRVPRRQCGLITPGGFRREGFELLDAVLQKQLQLPALNRRRFDQLLRQALVGQHHRHGRPGVTCLLYRLPQHGRKVSQVSHRLRALPGARDFAAMHRGGAQPLVQQTD